MLELVNLVLETGKILAPNIGRHFKYLYDYKTNLDNLEKVAEDLKKEKDRVDHEVRRAGKNVELNIKYDVKKWQGKSSIKIEEAEKFIQEKANNQLCLEGFCAPLISRYKNGRKAFNLKLELDTLLQDRDEFNKVFVSIYPEESWLEFGDGILYLEPIKSTLKSVWDALNDANNVYMIGVYGTNCDVNTALAEGARSKALYNNLFDKAVWVEVSETTDIEEIQDEIADSLGQKLEEESEKASQINARLNTDKRILLILNNITRHIDLKSVGIPSEADRGGCRLLLTSTGRRVLDKMGSKTFEIRFSNQQALDNYFLVYFSLVFTIFVVCFIVFALSFLQRKFCSF